MIAFFLVRTKSRSSTDPTGCSKHAWSPKHSRVAYVAISEGGLTVGGLAKLFDVSEVMINKWMRKHPRFKRAVIEGRYAYDTRKVVTSLLKKALGYDYVEVSKEDITIKHGKGEDKIKLPATKIRTTTKHVCPSDTAIIFWLTNRQPQEWQHIQKMLMKGQVNHTGEFEHKHEHEFDLKQVPKEELEHIRDILTKHVQAQGSSIPSRSGGRFGLPEPWPLHSTGLAPNRN